MNYRIPLSKPQVSLSDSFNLFRASRTGWLTQSGPEVSRMESSIKNYLTINGDPDIDMTTTSNGTTALHLALLALGVGEGDEVIIPNYCYVAVANSVLYCGASPVLVDCDWDTWSVSASLILPAITDKTKAVIVVDNYGFLSNINEIRQKLPTRISLILDAAESFPSPELANRVRSVDLCTFSLYANKIVTSGEGGGVIGRTPLIGLVKLLKNQALSAVGSFYHTQIGYNYRITNLSAAVFNSQWKRLPEILKKRRSIFDYYHKGIKLNSIEILADNVQASPWLYTVVLPVNKQRRDLIRSRISQAKIETRPGFTTIGKLPYLSNTQRNHREFPISDILSEQSLSLPTYTHLTRKEIDDILRIVADAVYDTKNSN